MADDFGAAVNKEVSPLLQPYMRGQMAEVMEVGSGANAGQVRVRLPGDIDAATADLPWAQVIGSAPTAGTYVFCAFDAYSRRVFTGGGGSSSSAITGEIKMWSTGTAPTGYLVCNGAQVSQTTYADLYAVLGNTYGTASGGNFYLPDYRGRVPVGTGTGDASDATNHTLGEKEGEEEVVLNLTEIPQHAHSLTFQKNTNTTTGGIGERVVDIPGSGGTSGNTGVAGGSGGVTQSHGNLQPSLGTTFIIKT